MLNKQAEELNNAIKKCSPSVYNMLSKKGKAIYFPKEGILAQSAEAKGKKIDATIGIATEDDGSPMRLESVAKNILLDPKDSFSYASSYGKPELRQKWKEDMTRKNPSLKCPVSTPVVTCAITHALSMAAYLFMDEGDKIITPDKFWGNYRLIFCNAYGAELETFNTFSGEGFDTKSLEKKLSEGKGKKILLLNFPNNPTGYTPTEKEAKEIAAIIKRRAEKGDEIVVIIDDAYFGFVYKKGVFTESLFTLLGDLHENVVAIKVDGATKEEYAWGFRVGFITYGFKEGSEAAYKAMEDKTAGAVRGSISNAPNISQSLILKAFSSPLFEKEKKQKYEILKKRFDKVNESLKQKKYAEFFKPLPFNSGYFMCVEVKDAEKVRQTLLKKYDTGVISTGNLLRIAFSSVPERDIPTIFENIYNACKKNK